MGDHFSEPQDFVPIDGKFFAPSRDESEVPAPMTDPDGADFSPYRAVAAEGVRIAFVTCLTCGATVTLDPADPVDVVELHRRWHAASPSVSPPPHPWPEVSKGTRLTGEFKVREAHNG